MYMYVQKYVLKEHSFSYYESVKSYFPQVISHRTPGTFDFLHSEAKKGTHEIRDDHLERAFVSLT